MLVIRSRNYVWVSIRSLGIFRITLFFFIAPQNNNSTSEITVILCHYFIHSLRGRKKRWIFIYPPPKIQMLPELSHGCIAPHPFLPSFGLGFGCAVGTFILSIKTTLWSPLPPLTSVIRKTYSRYFPSPHSLATSANQLPSFPLSLGFHSPLSTFQSFSHLTVDPLSLRNQSNSTSYCFLHGIGRHED